LVMSSLIQDVQAKLVSLNPAGGVFYGINTTEPPVYPFIVWQRVVSNANAVLQGPSDLQNTRVQVDIYSRSLQQAAQLETALEAAMAAWSVQNVPISSVDVYEEEVRAYRITKDYSIWSTNGRATAACKSRAWPSSIGRWPSCRRAWRATCCGARWPRVRR
jgi:hypothetical protein